MAGSGLLNRLREESSIQFSETFSLRQVTNEFFQRTEISVQPKIETGWLEMVLHCVRLGLGVTIVPRRVSRLSMTGITIVEIDEPCVPRRVLTALHRNESRQVPLTRRPPEIAYPFLHLSDAK